MKTPDLFTGLLLETAVASETSDKAQPASAAAFDAALAAATTIEGAQRDDSGTLAAEGKGRGAAPREHVFGAASAAQAESSRGVDGQALDLSVAAPKLGARGASVELLRGADGAEQVRERAEDPELQSVLVQVAAAIARIVAPATAEAADAAHPSSQGAEGRIADAAASVTKEASTDLAPPLASEHGDPRAWSEATAAAQGELTAQPLHDGSAPALHIAAAREPITVTAAVDQPLAVAVNAAAEPSDANRDPRAPTTATADATSRAQRALSAPIAPSAPGTHAASSGTAAQPMTPARSAAATAGATAPATVAPSREGPSSDRARAPAPVIAATPRADVPTAAAPILASHDAASAGLGDRSTAATTGGSSGRTQTAGTPSAAATVMTSDTPVPTGMAAPTHANTAAATKDGVAAPAGAVAPPRGSADAQRAPAGAVAPARGSADAQRAPAAAAPPSAPSAQPLQHAARAPATRSDSSKQPTGSADVLVQQSGLSSRSAAVSAPVASSTPVASSVAVADEAAATSRVAATAGAVASAPHAKERTAAAKAAEDVSASGALPATSDGSAAPVASSGAPSASRSKAADRTQAGQPRTMDGKVPSAAAPTPSPAAQVVASVVSNAVSPELAAAAPGENVERGRRGRAADAATDPLARVEGFTRGARFGVALSAYGGRGHDGGEHGARGKRSEERERELVGEAPVIELPAPTVEASATAQQPSPIREAPPLDLAPRPAAVPMAEPPPEELPEPAFVRTPGGQPQAASVSLHHPDLGSIELQVQRAADRIEVRAVIESAHAEAVLRANESGIRLGVQQSGMTFGALRVRVRGEERVRDKEVTRFAPVRKRRASEREI